MWSLAGIFDLWRQTRGYADRILKETRPADLPIEQATKFTLKINLKTVNGLGFPVTPTLLEIGDEVIERIGVMSLNGI